MDMVEYLMSLNPQLKGIGHWHVRLDGRIEWICPHGIGHTAYSPEGDYSHGCDGCCERYGLKTWGDTNE